MNKRKYSKKYNKSTFKVMKRKFLAYIMASRLGGWMIALIFFLLGEWYSGQSFPIHSSIIAICAIAGIASSAALINNVYDRELDTLSGKRSVWVFEYISPKEMLFTSFLLSLASLILLWCINLAVFIVGLSLIAMSLLYSAPPFRIKTFPPFDSIPNALGIGTFPFFLGWLMVDSQLTPISVIYGFILGLMCLSGYFLYTSVDVKTDKLQGIETSCTKIGVENTINVGLILFLIYLFLASIFFGIFSLITLSSFIILPLALIPKFKKEKMKKNIIDLIESIAFLMWTIVVLSYLSISSSSVIPILVLVLVFIQAYFIIFVYKRL